jgi:hypothetical protein
VVKLLDAGIKKNIPNVIKYILYFVLASVSNIIWRQDEKQKKENNE